MIWKSGCGSRQKWALLIVLQGGGGGGCLGSKRHCVLCSLHVGPQSQQWLPGQRPPRSEPPSNTCSSRARAPGRLLGLTLPGMLRCDLMWSVYINGVCDLLALVHFVCITILGGCLSTAELCTPHGCLSMIPIGFFSRAMCINCKLTICLCTSSTEIMSHITYILYIQCTVCRAVLNCMVEQLWKHWWTREGDHVGRWFWLGLGT